MLFLGVSKSPSINRIREKQQVAFGSSWSTWSLGKNSKRYCCCRVNTRFVARLYFRYLLHVIEQAHRKRPVGVWVPAQRKKICDRPFGFRKQADIQETFCVSSVEILCWSLLVFCFNFLFRNYHFTHVVYFVGHCCCKTTCMFRPCSNEPVGRHF